MSYVIRKIKIKQDDESFTEPIPIGSDSDHIIVDNTNLTAVLNNLTNAIEDLKVENKKLFDQIPSNTVSGEFLNIQDSSDYPIQEFEMLGNATQNISIMYYKCVGSESGDYYFVYDNTNYQFTMPNVAANDLLTFNTVSKKLYKSTTEITTTTASTGTLITLNNTPSPDYPVDIKVVTGDNVVKVAKKNLFNEILLSQQESYNTYNSTTGLWTTSQTSTGYNRSFLYAAVGTATRDKTKLIKIGPNMQYTLTLYNFTNNTSYTSGYIGLLLYDKDGTYKRKVDVSSSTPTFTTNSDEYYLDIARAASSGYFTFSHIQLEAGSTATTYEPYAAQTQLLSLGNIELAKIGDYQDRIYKQDGKWWLEKNIRKVYLKDLAFRKSSSSNLYIVDGFKTTYNSANINKTNGNGLSTHFVVGDPTNLQNGEIIVMSSEQLRILDNDITTIEAFVSFLNSNNPTFYYALETPTTTEITDTTLLAQLENILQMNTYKNVTNAWIELSGDNANGNLMLKYKQDLKTLFENS